MKTDLHKLVQVLLYLLEKEENKGNYTKLLKMIFLADKLHLKKYGRIISGDSYVALQHGPVASSTFDIIKSYSDMLPDSKRAFVKKHYHIIAQEKCDYDYLSETEKNILDEIYEYFGHLSFGELIDITHKYSEWKQFEEMIKKGYSCRIDIEDLFEDSLEQDNIFNIPEEHVEVSRMIYNENKSLGVM